MKVYLRFIGTSLAYLLVAAGWPAATAAPNDAVARIQSSAPVLITGQARGFRQTLDALARQTGRVFVAEGAPLQEAKPPPEAVGEERAATSDVLIARTASAFDYDVERRGSVILLRKRYTEARDLPGITLEESLAAARDVSRLMSAFSPRIQVPVTASLSRPLVWDIVRSLSETQIATLKNGGLPVSALSPAQQALVRRTALYLYVQQPLQEVEVGLAGIEQARTAVFLVKKEEGHPFLGYEVAGGQGRGATFVRLARLDAPAENAPPVPSAPSTLGAVVARLNRAGNLRAVVDPALSAKPVTVAGIENAPPAQVLNALAGVYGLRVIQGEDGVSRITRRSGRALANVANLPAAGRQALPSPLLRAARAALLTTLAANSEEQARQQEAEALPAKLRAEAVRQLRAALEPKFKADPQTQLPLKELSDAERNLLAVILATSLLETLNTSLPAQVPGYVARFDRTRLRGGVSERDGKSYFSLDMRATDETGRDLSGGAGVTVPFPPPP